MIKTTRTPTERPQSAGQLQTTTRLQSAGRLQPTGRIQATGRLQPTGRLQATGRLQPTGRLQGTGRLQSAPIRQPPGMSTIVHMKNDYYCEEEEDMPYEEEEFEPIRQLAQVRRQTVKQPSPVHRPHPIIPVQKIPVVIRSNKQPITLAKQKVSYEEQEVIPLPYTLVNPRM